MQPSALDAQGRRSAFCRQQRHKSLLQEKGGEIYLSVEEEPAGDCDEDPQEDDEFEDREDEEPDLCVKEG